MNITFIGMAGAGKSYVGRAFAQAHGCNFVDVDKVIEKKFGKTLQSILDELGDKAFIDAEAQVILGLKLERPTVIAPGGSVVYMAEVMEYLKEMSTIVYLQVPEAVIAKRITQSGRGIVGLKDKSFTELYEEREMLYTKYADVIVEPEGKEIKEVIQEIYVATQVLGRPVS